MTGIPTPLRSRTKTADLSEIFRSSHSSRQLPKTGALPDTPSEEKQKSRRSMLPFLGRRKTERLASSSALPRKSTNTPSGSIGKELLTVASSADGSPSDKRLPSTLPPLNVSPPSLGSKFAAHFSPLRSPTKTLKARYSSSYKSTNTPPTRSSATLSPPVADGRSASLESRRSSTINSRSTTPKPPLQPSAENVPHYDVLNDFSDLFTLPEPHSKPTKSSQKASTLPPVVVDAVNDSERCAELSLATPLTPASPTPPSSPRLQFPIPPSSFALITMASEKSLPQCSYGPSKGEPTTPSSKHSNSSLKLPTASPQHRFSISRERRSDRVATAGIASGDESDRTRAFSLSGSDTDASRATDSSVRSRRGRHHSALPKASAMKRPAPLQRAPSSSEKLSAGPPPSAPLPTPPPSAQLASRPPISPLPDSPSTNNVPSGLTVRSPGITPRPRASTLSATTSLSSAKLAAWMAPRTNPQDKHVLADAQSPASEDDLKNALALQNRKYAQLQEYAVTITKKFEDEKASMTKTIQMLEREIRKKVREIEGLRWLVIHNGGAEDIDAAANLARASLVTLDGDRFDAVRAMDATRSGASSQSIRSPTTNSSVGCRRGLGLDYLDQPSSSGASLEPPLPEFSIAGSASSSCSSLSLPMLTPTTSSLSVIPEQHGEISRAERQKAKEERRTSRVIRRISSSSMSSGMSGAVVTHPPLPTDHTFDSQSSMENALEKLPPF